MNIAIHKALLLVSLQIMSTVNGVAWYSNLQAFSHL